MPAECTFCSIASGELPADLVDEDDLSVAFMDMNPATTGHLLVVPRRHVASLHEADDPALLGALLAAAREVAEGEGIGRSGYRVVINTGPDGGQEVPHLHLHVLGGRRLGLGLPQG